MILYSIAAPTESMILNLDRLCRRAVDRRRGQLLYIAVSYFGNDNLIRYITERCTQIKCLRLASCPNISDEGLTEAATKLPLLEELELTLCSLSAKPLEAVGRSCPRLTSLRLNSLVSVSEYEDKDDNREAIAIATNMPELRHLQIIGNLMNNSGLQAILSGCPNLKSLDPRQCPYLYLTGKLGERCGELECLLLPTESTKDEDGKFYVGPDEVDLCEFRKLHFLSDRSYHEYNYDCCDCFSGGSDSAGDNTWLIMDYYSL